MELADIVVVNKADGALQDAARHAEAEYRHALALLRRPERNWQVPVLHCSAVSGTGIAEIWETVGAYRAAMATTGADVRRRAEQSRTWLWSEIRETLLADFQRHPAVRAALPDLEAQVTAGTLAPGLAARELLARYAHDQ